VLGAVKTEFAKYEDILKAVQKKLLEASNKVESGLTRTRAIHRKLKSVEAPAAGEVVALPAAEGDDSEAESLADESA